MRLTKSFKYYLLRIIESLYLLEALRIKRISLFKSDSDNNINDNIKYKIYNLYKITSYKYIYLVFKY